MGLMIPFHILQIRGSFQRRLQRQRSIYALMKFASLMGLYLILRAWEKSINSFDTAYNKI
jgi:hypothetical protein